MRLVLAAVLCAAPCLAQDAGQMPFEAEVAATCAAYYLGAADSYHYIARVTPPEAHFRTLGEAFEKLAQRLGGDAALKAIERDRYGMVQLFEGYRAGDAESVALADRTAARCSDAGADQPETRDLIQKP